MIRSLAPLVLALVSLMSTSVVVVEARVDLCGAPGRIPPMDRFDCLIHVNPNLSCGQLFFQVAGMNTNPYTIQMLGLFGNMCCNSNVAKQCIGHPGGNQGTQNNPAAAAAEKNKQDILGRPGGYGGRGPNLTCNLCRSGGTMQDTFNANGNKLHYNLRYIGRANAGFSCSQLDWLARNGYFPNFMCGPVMSILPRHCPCSEGNGAWQQAVAPAPTPQPPTVGSGSGNNQCSAWNSNKNACKANNCKYNKRFGTCIAN